MFEQAWAAGFFDGEGNTNAWLQKSSWRLQLSVTQIHRETLERFRAAVGGVGMIYGPYYTKTGRHAQYTFKARGALVPDVLSTMWEYLSPPKQIQATVALDRWRSTLRTTVDV